MTSLFFLGIFGSLAGTAWDVLSEATAGRCLLAFLADHDDDGAAVIILVSTLYLAS